MNKVIAGDYKLHSVLCPLGGVPRITLPGFKVLLINKDTVESYETINEVHQAGRGKNQISIQFKDGKKSLLEVDDRIFRKITIALF